MLSDVMEDYLKAIYVLQREGGAPVSNSEVADYLGVTAPTVSSMVEKLADRDLLEREKYKGVELTEEGESVALEVIRHHRLIEAFLTEVLDYDWSEVHEEADRLEHHISEEFERRVAETLDDPEVDPHGAPIPDEDLSRPDRPPGTRLDEVAAGDRVVVDRVPDDDEDVLEYLQEAGLTPGTELRIDEVAPFGMVTAVAEDDGGSVSLPEEVARSIRVTWDEDPDDLEPADSPDPQA